MVDLVMVVVILCTIAYCVSVCRRFFLQNRIGQVDKEYFTEMTDL